MRQKVEGESENERFRRVSEKRVNRIIRAIKVLTNCANRRVYEYSKDEVQTLFNAIEAEVKKAKDKFEPQETRFVWQNKSS